MAEARPGGKPRPDVRVVPAEEAHADAMAEFFRQVWDPEATAESVLVGRRAEARDNPGGGGAPPPSFLFFSGDRIVGYVSTIPTRIRVAGEERPMHWMKGLMVLPEHRNGPIGFLVVKEALRHLDGALAMAVALPARRIFTTLGFHDLGAVPNRLRLLAAGRVAARVDLEALGMAERAPRAAHLFRLAQRSGLARLGGGISSLGFRLWSALGTRASGYRAASGETITSEGMDRLWQRSRGKLAAAAVRDGAYFDWRYAAAADQQ